MFTDIMGRIAVRRAGRRSSPASLACAPASRRSARRRPGWAPKGDITIAQALKPLGYATGQFGKNHLGDLDEYLPTNHGFDEFFGNLYHLNAEEEPEQPYWPKDDKEFLKAYHPRAVIRSFAGGRIEDTGPLTRNGMETIDDETTAAAIDFMKRQVQANKPFFTWMNTTRMHAFTHVRESMRGQSGMVGNEYADGMVEHDGDVGKLLKALDDLGISDTLSSSTPPTTGPTNGRGPMPQPRRSQREGYELGRRVPCSGDDPWPGKIKPGEVSNQIVSGLDWFPTLLAAAGDADVKDRLLQGWQPPDNPTTFKNHLDGYNQLDYLTGKSPNSARSEFYYFSDDGDLVAMRYDDWKIVFAEQRKPGGFVVWANPSLPCARRRYLTCEWIV